MRRAGRDGQPAPLGEFLDVRVAAGPAAEPGLADTAEQGKRGPPRWPWQALSQCEGRYSDPASARKVKREQGQGWPNEQGGAGLTNRVALA
jgi:hypothetical protein